MSLARPHLKISMFIVSERVAVTRVREACAWV
jgi:hypothetical protein